MHPSINKLLSVSSEAIVSAFSVEAAVPYLSRWGSPGRELAELLNQRNGFYAFESALLVRPYQHKQAPLGLVQWNDPELWKVKYDKLDLGEVLFFAEDVFGGQFGIRDEKVHTFHPETGASEAMCASLSTWASELVADYKFRTGYPLAHTWQTQYTSLKSGTRLLPKVPFVCGGKHEIGNLYAVSDVKGMLFRASLANQIRDLPDGSQIIFDVERD